MISSVARKLPRRVTTSSAWATSTAGVCKQYPVILGAELDFLLEVLHDTFQFASIPTIPMANPFPLPQAGYVAFIINPEDSVVAGYRIMELSLEARQRWSVMGDLLREWTEPILPVHAHIR